ncbi:AAA family ATPase [Methanosarcina mazei]|jgi:MoxR-like ATPase|uniref:ATPase AAA n=8 Tax=Methanosarcina mazei TaxID=2209 RepID=A0A0F8Q772_METMZ|nr:MoxR family ATPase [Methanosarcina mazei]AAM32363.1 MoxR-like ATPase [Methanosarcina mazei Go1]AGF98022.1 MoxR ATPase -like protein [Methanosarcina mazei Tuc01]AKB40938.1 MoxR-like ATPase [Methanosarcina mazei WWM610]AKB61890.1 MoxR-like ATPase [Methanosarcina mazei SarPi]AKB65232.1 MoxR-like ATPase [Methanosarcina mazei S-6]
MQQLQEIQLEDSELNLKPAYEKAPQIFEVIFREIGNSIVGQKEMIRQILIAMLCEGHVLVESNPGLGKTLTISTISQIMSMRFSRIQCTPDLMPADITGTDIIEEDERGSKHFKFKQGPVFANIVLADEINRASPKTQSALLEAMQEKQVTVANTTYTLDKPFFILATQNPIEMEGTYALPEAQLDRFLMKIRLDYPDPDEEFEIVNRYAEAFRPSVRKCIEKQTFIELQQITRRIPISNKLKKYAIDIVNQTRKMPDMIEAGASPRASIALILCAKANAFIDGRGYVDKGDIDAMALPVLRHRVILSFDAARNNITSDKIIQKILEDRKTII